MKRTSFLLVLLLLLALLSTNDLGAQVKLTPQFEQQLQGKKFYEARTVIEDLLKTEMKKPMTEDQLKALRSQRKKINRYLYDAESRLNAAGEIENGSQRIFEYLTKNTNNARTLSIAGAWQFVGPTSVTDGIGRINRLAFDPSNAQKIWAGSSGGGLFVTITGGLAWTNVGSFIPSLGISGIVVSHANSNTIYVLTGDGSPLNW